MGQVAQSKAVWFRLDLPRVWFQVSKGLILLHTLCPDSLRCPLCFIYNEQLDSFGKRNHEKLVIRKIHSNTIECKVNCKNVMAPRTELRPPLEHSYDAPRTQLRPPWTQLQTPLNPVTTSSEYSISGQTYLDNVLTILLLHNPHVLNGNRSEKHWQLQFRV